MNAYKQAMKQNYEWQRNYASVPDDTGIVSPEGYNVYPDPSVPYILTAAQFQQGVAPIYTNPAAELYSSGQQNQVLLSAAQPQCNTGCLYPAAKPDPRVLQVKPLYEPSVFKAAPGTVLPTSYNVVGMY